MCVAVASLALKHDAWFVPAAARHIASVASANHLCQVLLASEEYFDVLVQTATTIEADVDYDTVAFVEFAQHFAVNLTVAGIIHRLDVNIAKTATRHAVDDVLIVLNPALVEQIVEGTTTDRLHHFVPSFASGGIAERNERLHASLSVEHCGVVIVISNLLAVDFLNNAASFYFGFRFVERSTSHYLGNLEATASVAHIVEQT